MKSHTLLCLDIKQSGTLQVVSAKRGDTARCLEIRLHSGTEPWLVDPGCQAVMTGRKADGTSLFNACEVRDGAVFYQFTEQTTSCAGEVSMELRIYGGENQLITTALFVLEVYDTVYTARDAAKSQDEQTALNELMNKTVDAKNAAEAITEEIRGKLNGGEFIGESAYEEAVRLGYVGTEEAWLASLRYDHSQEFEALSQQVQENTQAAENAAGTASQASAAADGSASAAASSADAAKAAERAAADSAKTSGEKAQAAAGSAQAAERQAQLAAEAAKLRHVPVIHARETQRELQPNVLYVWDDISELTVTLSAGLPDAVNEYMFQFSSPGEKPTNLNLPGTVKWIQHPLVEGGKTYQVSIVNEIGVIAGV